MDLTRFQVPNYMIITNTQHLLRFVSTLSICNLSNFSIKVFSKLWEHGDALQAYQELERSDLLKSILDKLIRNTRNLNVTDGWLDEEDSQWEELSTSLESAQKMRMSVTEK